MQGKHTHPQLARVTGLRLAASAIEGGETAIKKTAPASAHERPLAPAAVPTHPGHARPAWAAGGHLPTAPGGVVVV